ncbi:Uncharacterised protein [Vibrio cholerae]|uniref:Uncharacterized protein n=1 Tax=Vibrio cholerae TaxID=666 RepID=A0A655ZTD3_VIBCL|nr:Uncharacterised protein [Vibrio cholerae]CSA17949.1 Uncharacterised protein [Vibrio cholerae]CSB55312.1 Uncharacterised protein [Vibrio cholerae]CSC74574.1 Uncharacterised protein [Vibrio cholerae]CSC80058.1 Uncharacterised protein [Vibrio cholerae]
MYSILLTNALQLSVVFFIQRLRLLYFPLWYSARDVFIQRQLFLWLIFIRNDGTRLVFHITKRFVEDTFGNTFFTRLLL